uniref:Uncharacterized protein n=1 Tax=Oryza punctata TaxID=4537 RepID=A0A0E0M0Z4_ORYPU
MARWSSRRPAARKRWKGRAGALSLGFSGARVERKERRHDWERIQIFGYITIDHIASAPPLTSATEVSDARLADLHGCCRPAPPPGSPIYSAPPLLGPHRRHHPRLVCPICSGLLPISLSPQIWADMDDIWSLAVVTEGSTERRRKGGGALNINTGHCARTDRLYRIITKR